MTDPAPAAERQQDQPPTWALGLRESLDRLHAQVRMLQLEVRSAVRSVGDLKPQASLDGHQWLTVEQVAKLLGRHAGTVREDLKAGRLPGTKIGHGWRVRADLLDDVVDTRNRADALAAARGEEEPPRRWMSEDGVAWVGVSELVSQLGRGSESVTKALREGRIPGTKVHGVWRVQADAIEGLLTPRDRAVLAAREAKLRSLTPEQLAEGRRQSAEDRERVERANEWARARAGENRERERARLAALSPEARAKEKAKWKQELAARAEASAKRKAEREAKRNSKRA